MFHSEYEKLISLNQRDENAFRNKLKFKDYPLLAKRGHGTVYFPQR